MKKSANQIRVVVVGGGVVGCAAAYQLAQTGFQVTLLERDQIGAHASGRNAGNLNPLHGTPKQLVPFALAAFLIHREIRAELDQLGCAPSQALPVDRLHLGYEEDDWMELEQTAEICNRHENFAASWLSAVELRRMEPRLAADVRFGLHATGALSIDGSGFTRSLAEGAARLGAIVLCAAVLGIKSSNGRVTAVCSSQGVIPCDEVVFATGPWVADTNVWLGIDLPVMPVKGELLLVRLQGKPPPCDFTWKSACLYRRRSEEVWIGGTRTNFGMHSGCEAMPTPEGKELLLQGAERMIPSIRQATVLDHIAALRPVTAADTPVACRAANWENVFLANGAGSKGILLCVGIARMIRDLLLNNGGGHRAMESLT